MKNYLEGNVYEIDGKKQIYQVDGTFRDASITEPPKPVDYEEPTPAPVVPTTPAVPEKTITRTVENENPSNPGTTTYYSDGTSSFSPKRVNPQGMTSSEMVTYSNNQTPAVTYNPDGTRVLTDAEKKTEDYYASKEPKTPEEIAAEEEAIRQKRLERQQAEIDTVNAMYANILNQIGVDNKDRLGSTATIQALTGERGSKSGQADVKKTTDYNTSVVQAAEAEKANKIAAIMSDYAIQIDKDLETARKNRETDAESWIEYQNTAAERNRTNATNLRASLIDAGIEASEIDEPTWQKIADAGGYTVAQAKALYKSDYDKKQAAMVAAEEEAALEFTKKQLDNAKTEAEVNKILSEAANTAEEKENLLIKEGYIYMSTPAQRDQYAKQGRIMVTVNGRTYMAPMEKDPNKTSGGSTTDKNYTATTIPADIKADLLADKAAGVTEEELMVAYPEVSTTYIGQLFGKNTVIID